MLIHLALMSFMSVALPLVCSSIEQVNWKRAKRQSCSCVTQYTPVNCKCQASNGPGGDLLCRCDRAAVLSHPACRHCPHTQVSQQPVPPIYTPSAPIQSASYVAAMCQPICRQNCVQTCNAANNYPQVPFTATGQHHFSSYPPHDSNTPQCHPSQCQYTCKRACSQVPAHQQTLPLATHMPAFGSYPSSAISSLPLYGATAVCSCPPEEDFCTCQQCFPMCADSCEISCQQQQNMSPSLVLLDQPTAMMQAESVQLVPQCIPICRQNCMKTCGDGSQSKMLYGGVNAIKMPQPLSPSLTTTTEQSRTEMESSLADCFVRCPQSCQKACNNLLGSTTDNCQPACQSMCAQSCRQHEENMHKQKLLHSPMQKENRKVFSATSNPSLPTSTTPSAVLPEEADLARPPPPLPISMDEASACAPLCQPDCHKTCISRYLEPPASATTNDQQAAASRTTIKLHDLQAAAPEKAVLAAADNSNNLLNHLRQKTAVIESVDKALTSLAQLRQQAAHQIPKLTTTSTPNLAKYPEVSSSEIYMVPQSPIILQPPTGYYFPSVNDRRQNVGFMDEFMMRRKFNKLQHYQQVESDKTSLGKSPADFKELVREPLENPKGQRTMLYPRVIHYPAAANRNVDVQSKNNSVPAQQQAVLMSIENTSLTTNTANTLASIATTSTQQAIIAGNPYQLEKYQNTTLIDLPAPVSILTAQTQLEMNVTTTTTITPPSTVVMSAFSSTPMTSTFSTAYILALTSPITSTPLYPQTVQQNYGEEQKDDRIAVPRSDNNEEIALQTEASNATMAVVPTKKLQLTKVAPAAKLIGRRAISNSYANLFSQKDQQNNKEKCKNVCSRICSRECRLKEKIQNKTTGCALDCNGKCVKKCRRLK